MDSRSEVAHVAPPNEPNYTTPPHLFALLRQYAGVQPSEHATQLIRRVHDEALEQYRITKKRKQQQLACKIVDAQRCGDRVLLKTAKKKVANHASAVASRVKQEFIVSRFERLLSDSITDAFRLSDVLYRHVVLLSDRDDQIRRLSDKVAMLSQQLNPLLSPQPQQSQPQQSQPQQSQPQQSQLQQSQPQQSQLQPQLQQAQSPFDALGVGVGASCGGDGGLSFELSELLSGAASSACSCGNHACQLSDKLSDAPPSTVLPSRQRALRDALLSDADASDVSLNPVA